MTTSAATAVLPHDDEAPPQGEAARPRPVEPPHVLVEAQQLLTLAVGRRTMDLSAPSPGRLALACLGFGTAFGAASLSMPLAHMPSVAAAGLVAALGTAVLTGPALLILHQFVGLLARPVDVLAALSRGFADAGQVALGITPFVFMLALTSRLGLPAVLLCTAGLGALTLALTHRRLLLLERQHPDTGLRHQLVMFALATAWGGLAALVAGRIALGLLLPAILS